MELAITKKRFLLKKKERWTNPFKLYTFLETIKPSPQCDGFYLGYLLLK